MVTSDEDLEVYEGEDSEHSEGVMLIEEERVDSDETRDEVGEDSENARNLLEGLQPSFYH